MRVDRLVLSCEHGGHRVPRAFAPWFAEAGDLLRSHRGWDPGALDLARRLARALGAPLVASTVTRMLVDLNRSPGHPRLFSELVPRDRAIRERVLARHHAPHRARVEAAVRPAGRGERVLHLAVHSFTPVLAGRRRDTELGLLYDPARAPERELCASLARELATSTGLRVHRNRPYRGVSDGLTTALRRRLPAARYLGVELEVSQRLLVEADARPAPLARAIAAVLRDHLRPGRSPS